VFGVEVGGDLAGIQQVHRALAQSLGLTKIMSRNGTYVLYSLRLADHLPITALLHTAHLACC